MESRKAVQGTGDGLCGFYALINFLLLKNLVEEDEGRSDKQEAFRYLAEAAERLGLLSPIKLVGGYEWHELVEIFNLDAQRRHTGYRAVPIQHLQAASGKGLVSDIVEQGGAAVLLVQNGGHWVLAHDQNSDRLLVVDPSYREPIRTLERVSNLGAGIAILPLSSALLEAVDA